MAKVRKVQITAAQRSARKADAKRARARARAERVANKAKAKAGAEARKAANLKAEAERAAAAATRREIANKAKAAKIQKERIATQAALFTKRTSMDATYRVWIKFARGAHDLRIASEAPKGYRESRASAKVRGENPGLRYRECESIRDGIARKFAANPTRRRA
jgi:hypothetical protein